MAAQAERFRKLSPAWWTILVIFSAVALLTAIYQVFHIRIFGFLFVDTAYVYIILGLYLSPTFIVFPARNSARRDTIPWYDYILFFLCLGIAGYYVSIAYDILFQGYEFYAPPLPTFLGIGLWLLALEAIRRVAGRVLLIVCGLASVYPLFAEHMPGFLEGTQLDFLVLARFHAMSLSSIMGIPMRVVALMLIGFMVFGVVLQRTGGGKFFLDFSMALLGKRRGGPAKVAVVASGFFGSVSGSVLSNVATTGSITIPAMKRIGYPPTYAAAIEACASTGGVLMPPIMGAAAFLMASVVGVSYVTVVICAIIPALLYYLGLIFQVDNYAAKVKLKGLDPNEIPPIWLTLKEGWMYIFTMLVLVYLLVYQRAEAEAPFIAIALLLICTMTRKETRLSWKDLGELFASTGRLMIEITAILAGIGLLIGSITVSGLGLSFSHEIVALAGGNLLLLLLFGAAASTILGMGLTNTACYLLLAVVLAPALVKLGLNILAVHLFVMYWGMISYITPPMCLGAIAASSISGSKPFETGFMAMRLGATIYFVPFFFVLNPALILQASLAEIAVAIPSALLGVYMLAGGLEGYMAGIGKLGAIARVLVGVGGLLLVAPETVTDIVGLAIMGSLLVYRFGVSRDPQQRGANTGAAPLLASDRILSPSSVTDPPDDLPEGH